MTNTIQYSKKFADGSIVVVGGTTVADFEKNYEAFIASPIVGKMFKEQIQIAPQGNGKDVAPVQQVAVTERVILPKDAVLTVVRTGDKYRGEIEPFPGTIYAVWVWPEVLDNAPGFDKDTTSTIDVGEWEVEYSVKAANNGKMYPDKVTRFV